MQPGTLPQSQAPQEDQEGFYRPNQPSAYNAPDTPEQKAAPEPSPQGVTWEASEYIHHAKNPLWTVGLVAVAALGVGIALWFSMWTFAALVVVMAIALGIFAFRPPRVMHYELNASGIKIDGKFYSFKDFRAFGILAEGAFFSIMLIPTKRFMPALSLYFGQEDGEKIVDILGSRLPMEELKPDFLDAIVRRLRF